MSSETRRRDYGDEAIPGASTIEEMLAQQPLLRFSTYTQLQVDALRSLGNEIRPLLDSSFSEEGGMNGYSLGQIYSKTWFWVLGAFEVVRTLSTGRAKRCLSDRLHGQAEAFRRNIARLRIPMSKQELAGRADVIGTDISFAHFNNRTRDIGFSVDSSAIWIRQMLNDFDELVDSVTPEDVLCDLRDASRREG
ncbi:MAG: hypothetical protein H6934_06435 [Burkholderiaceae bacterium]|nr:hypothetical protein [Burkholderiaceae bacterium]